MRFLLVTALTLMHGWQLAVVAGALVLAVLSVVGQAEWSNFGANLLCMAVIPALFTAWFHEQVHARLPHNYFIYFFVTAFLGSALAFNLAGLARFMLIGLSGTLRDGRRRAGVLGDPALDELRRSGRERHDHRHGGDLPAALGHELRRPAVPFAVLLSRLLRGVRSVSAARVCARIAPSTLPQTRVAMPTYDYHCPATAASSK